MIRALKVMGIAARMVIGLAALYVCAMLTLLSAVYAPSTVALAIVAGVFGLVSMGNAGRAVAA